MTVNDTSYSIGNRLVGVVALNEHGVNSRNGALFEIARPLKKLGHSRVYGRCIASCNGSFARGKTYLTLSHSVTCEGVHHQKHVLALVLEILGNGGGGHGAFVSHHRGLIGGGNYQYRPCHTLRTQVSLDKFKNLSASLAHKSDNVDVRLHLSCYHTEKCGFTNARACENAHSLPSADSKQSVNSLNSKWDNIVNRRARQRIDGLSRNGIAFHSFDRSAAVNGVSHRIYDPADKAVANADFKLVPRVVHHRPRTDALNVGVGHKHYRTVTEAHHFGIYELARPALFVNAADIADVADRTACLDGHTDDLFNFALIAVKLSRSHSVSYSLKVHLHNLDLCVRAGELIPPALPYVSFS